jgi:hypothetical protein
MTKCPEQAGTALTGRCTLQGAPQNKRMIVQIQNLFMIEFPFFIPIRVISFHFLPDFLKDWLIFIKEGEAVIAKEHAKSGLETTIFYMDMRTFGKGFDPYYVRSTGSGSSEAEYQRSVIFQKRSCRLWHHR